MKLLSSKENSCRLLVSWSKTGIVIITSLAIYSPPKHVIKKEQYITFFKTLGNSFIATGDYNVKYTHWESRLILPKGHELLKAIKVMNLATLFIDPPTGHPMIKTPLIYWTSVLSRTFLKITVTSSPVLNCPQIILL